MLTAAHIYTLGERRLRRGERRGGGRAKASEGRQNGLADSTRTLLTAQELSHRGQAQAQIEVQAHAQQRHAEHKRGRSGQERGRSVGQLYIGHCSRVNAQHSLGRMVATAARGGRGARGARHACKRSQDGRADRGPQARRGEAKVLETAAEPKRDEQGRAQVLRSRNCAAPSGIPIQFNRDTHRRRRRPAPRAVPKTRRLPRKSAGGAREGPRRPLSILARPRPKLDLPSSAVCRWW